MDAKKKLLSRLVTLALDEDRAAKDVTTLSLAEFDAQAKASVKAKARGVTSGSEIFAAVFLAVDPDLEVDIRMADGSTVEPGTVVAHVTGNESSILRGERTALNFYQHLSGVATLTRRFVEAISGTKAMLLDTRKTTPCLRSLEKEAVLHGGGRNHRLHLEEMALVKENHIEMAGGIPQAVAAIRRHFPGKRIEVEVKNQQELQIALDEGVEMIMLDNFTTPEAREAVAINAGRARLEISGNVTLENIREKAETGVDFISVGSLTHSAPALDLSLLLERKP